MKNIFLSLKNLISRQNKEKKNQKRIFNSRGSKLIVGSGAEVTINSKLKTDIEEVRKNVEIILNQTNADCDKLLDYIIAANTPVYEMKFASKFLKFIGEEEGLIYEQKGLKALFLSIITGQGVKFYTSPMFIMQWDNFNKYFFLHHFYRWYALKSGLPGFDYRTQCKFKKYFKHNSKSDIKDLKMEDILDLQEAVSRDQEATVFVLEYSTDKEGSKNVMDKLKSDGSASI